LLKCLILVVVVLVISGCASLAWYGQAVQGQLDLLSRRELIVDLINDPATDPELARRLATVLEIRAFAVAELELPDGRSYRHYADLERDAAVWNVVAVPRFSMQPRTWCYPITGCVSYRAFFDLDRARTRAAELAEQGLDVAVFPAVAYSTLGWFADPVLNTMLAFDDAALAGFLFHELAHEKLFVRGDIAFNEAYAVTVERVGVRRWLQDRGDVDLLADWEGVRREREMLSGLLLKARTELIELYGGDLDEPDMAAHRSQVFAELQASLAEKAEASDSALLSGWAARPLNNAHLAMTATYEAGVAAFEAMLEECQSEMSCFHRRAAGLGRADAAGRRQFLQSDID
jgi:predicted aminopeptidase